MASTRAKARRGYPPRTRVTVSGESDTHDNAVILARRDGVRSVRSS